MPKLKIDGYEIEVPKGMKVIEAAERLGIIIPRFCYHPALGSAGACRVCAVKFQEGPIKGIQMSCMTEARDGMVISTTDEEAADFRRHVIEWLMMNHPHDCPVCDEGGHCLLQDLTVAGGHGIRRYQGNKRTYLDQYLGVFVQHEMNRCIHCYRCWRFYQEFSGYRDLGVMQIAYRTYFGRFSDGPLESPFSGNLIDICPTGVYTDKPARFKGRRWDFQRGPSICIHCSLGCHTVASARYREMVRQEARFSETVNGYFICDRGRFGFYYTNHPERPRRAKIGKEDVSWEEALRVAGESLNRISEKTGPGSIACLGSLRSSLENQGMLKRFCHLQGWEAPKYFINPSVERKVKKAVSGLDSRTAVSLREIEGADFILVLGADPVNEAPMLALAMRQAFRNGAAVAVVDPRPVVLPFEFDHLPLAPGDMDSNVKTMMRRAVSRTVAEGFSPEALQYYDALPAEYRIDSLPAHLLGRIEQKIKESRRPVIVCGTDVVQYTTISLAADSALLLKAAKDWAGLFYLLPGPNAFGAALLSSAGGSLEQIVEAIEKGSVKALLLVENDPFWQFPNQQRLKQALDKLEFLLVMDYLPSRAAQYAHVFLPTSMLFETGSSFVNQEGRVQFAAQVHSGGIPIEQVSAGDHPPRLLRGDIPGGEPRPAWRVLTELAKAMSAGGQGQFPEMLLEDLWSWMSRELPVLASGQPLSGRPDGLRLLADREKENPFSSGESVPTGENPGENFLELLLVDWIFGTEELSSYSQYVQMVETPACLFMHVKDAGRLNLKDKDKVIIHLDRGPVTVELSTVVNMAPGVIILPRHRQVEWQKVEGMSVMVPIGRIKKI